MKKYGFKDNTVSERRVSMDEIVAAYESGKLKESFGSGTAAVISPVGVIGYKGRDMLIGGGKMGEVTEYLYNTVTAIQRGMKPDDFGWVEKVK